MDSQSLRLLWSSEKSGQGKSGIEYCEWTTKSRMQPHRKRYVARTLALVVLTAGAAYWNSRLPELVHMTYPLLGASLEIKDASQSIGNDLEGAIHWYSCGNNFECGRLSVPLDYFDQEAGNASLSLIRYLATDSAKKLGSLLVNPGGPGGSGVAFVRVTGKELGTIVNGRYDIVSWDPRGVSETLPRFECFASETEQRIAVANTHLEVPDEYRNLLDPLDFAAFGGRMKLTDARNKMIATVCQERSAKVAKYVSTTTVVRDLVALHDALHGTNKPINYWGFSYGTIVGSYLVNMFPDRVGRVIIDGVLNPDIWANQRNVFWKHVFFSDTEKVLANFYAECEKAGPERCMIASPGSTASDISNKIDGFLDKLYEHPMAVLHASRPGILTSSMIKYLMFRYMYIPRAWPTLAKILSSAMAGNGTFVVQQLLKKIELDTSVPPATIGLHAAVVCTDSPDYSDLTEDEALEQLLNEAVVFQGETSTHFGGLQSFAQLCHHTSVKAAERFTGPFNHTLSNEILIIGNTADPVTPLRNAIAVNKLLGTFSRLLVHDGSGHCSMSTTSLCTLKFIREYLVEGRLPPNGTICSVDEQIFPDTFEEAEYLSISSRPSWLKESTLAKLTVDDLELLRAGREVGQKLHLFTREL